MVRVRDAMLSCSQMVDLESLAPERIRPLKRVEYEKMVELGLFEDERIELLAGFLVEMSPQSEAHAYAVQRLNELLVVGLHGRAVIRPQCPMALSDDSEPEPDFIVAPPVDYSHEHPGEAYLIVEVAQSSLRKDRRLKWLLYAAAGVPEYWIVNVVDGVFEVYRDPQPDGYASVTRAGRGESVAPLRFPDLVIRVDDVLPPV
jgi:Uma2 family endonuclease